MDNNVIFNLFSDSKTVAIEKICSYFNLPPREVENSLIDGCSADSFINEFRINLNSFDSSNIHFVGRHITTANERTLCSFREKGLWDLHSSLQSETPLSNFLKNFKIQIDIENKIFKFNKRSITIEGNKDFEHVCFMGRDATCRWSCGCEAFQKLAILHHKIYDFEATLEFFVAGGLDEMLGYSTISHCPEILDTIDQLISSVCRPYALCTYPLCYKWTEEHPDCYLMEFEVSLSHMETYNPINYIEAFSEIKNCFNWSNISFEDYCEHTISQRVFDNIYLINKIINAYVYNDREQYGSLLPGLSISPNELKIYKVSGKELIAV